MAKRKKKTKQKRKTVKRAKPKKREKPDVMMSRNLLVALLDARLIEIVEDLNRIQSRKNCKNKKSKLQPYIVYAAALVDFQEFLKRAKECPKCKAEKNKLTRIRKAGK